MTSLRGRAGRGIMRALDGSRGPRECFSTVFPGLFFCFLCFFLPGLGQSLHHFFIRQRRSGNGRWYSRVRRRPGGRMLDGRNCRRGCGRPAGERRLLPLRLFSGAGPADPGDDRFGHHPAELADKPGNQHQHDPFERRPGADIIQNIRHESPLKENPEERGNGCPSLFFISQKRP